MLLGIIFRVVPLVCVSVIDVSEVLRKHVSGAGHSRTCVVSWIPSGHCPSVIKTV